MKKILPIGSIVRLNNGAQKLMIINRAPLYNNEGNIGYFEYSACLYPSGQTNQNVFFFNEENIAEVLFTGYSDEDEQKFCELFEAEIGKGKYERLTLKIEER